MSTMNSMFFTIKIDNIDKLKSLMKEAQGDYLTLLATSNMVYFVYDSPELYLHHSFVVLSRYNVDGGKIVRISKKEFLNLIVEGTAKFVINESTITVEFYHKDSTDKMMYSYTAPYQEDLLDKYLDKIDLFSNVKEYPRIELANSLEIVKIAKTLGTTVVCGKTHSQVSARGVFIFKEDKSEEFTVGARMLDLLLKFSTSVYNVSNYIVYSKDDTCIAVVKHRHVPGEEFDFVKKQPSTHRVEFKCNHMLTLAKKLKLTEGEFYIDFDSQTSTFVQDKVAYTTPISVIKMQNAKDRKQEKELEEKGSLEFDLTNFSMSNDSIALASEARREPKIRVPDVVLKGVLSNLNIHDSVVMFIKKRFILMECGKVNVAFRREGV
ncbi:hypothetical protein UT300012_23780 [Paraclostridium bifermentans]